MSAEPAVATVPAPDLAAIARRFAEAWARPDPDRLVALLTDDVRLLQPVTPELRGKEAVRRDFAALLRWLPDMRGEIDAIAAGGDTLLIAFRLIFTVGGGPYELRVVDRIAARGDLIAEREAYFDSLGFFLTVLRRPRAWLGYLRYRGYLP
jgi:ketosteroid isomerase-like protein